MTAEEILALLQILGPLAQHAIDAYQKAREAAAKAGISEADLAAADARFLHHYEDPLAGQPTPTPVPPPVTFPYGEILDAAPDKTQLKGGDRIYQRGTQYLVLASGVGTGEPAGWTLVETVA